MTVLSRGLVVWLIASMALPGCATPVKREPLQVLMVCEHGSVKSLMAASLFNKEAAQRHLPYRALSRGVRPDAAVPAPIAASLTKEGFDVAGFVPSRVSATDVAQAARVVVIGIEPEALGAQASATMDAWQDVPAASVDYAAASAALQKHITALLDDLEKSGSQ